MASFRTSSHFISPFTKVLRPNFRRGAHESFKTYRSICSCTKRNSNVLHKPMLLQQKVPQIKNLQQLAHFSKNVKPRSMTSGPLSWKGLLLCLVAGGGVWYYVRSLKMEKELEKEKEKSRSIGKAALGGPFELIDQDGKPKTNKDFLGQWILIYFGFTHCPDICPDQLDKITEVINILDNTKGLPKIQPIFITVDPKRDDPKSIKEYLQDFHPRFIGLSGDEPAIKAVTKAYRVYYSAGPKDDDEDYIVDHTIITYLVNPEGKFIEYFGQNKTIDQTTSTIGTRMINYKLTQ